MTIPHEKFQELHEIIDNEPENQPSDISSPVTKKQRVRTSFHDTTSTPAILNSADAIARWQQRNETGYPPSRLEELEEKHGKQS